MFKRRKDLTRGLFQSLLFHNGLRHHELNPDLLERFLNRLAVPTLIVGSSLATATVATRLGEAGWRNVDAFLPLLALLGPVALLAMILRPVLSAIAFLGFVFVGIQLFPPVEEVGQLTVRYNDILLIVLGAAIFMRLALEGRITVSREVRRLFLPFAPFILYAGASVVSLSFTAPQIMAAAVASYLRFLSTVGFGFLLHMAIRDRRDLSLLHGSLIMYCVAVVLIGAWQGWSVAEVSGERVEDLRTGGLLQVNYFSAIAGLLVLYAVVHRRARKGAVFFFAIGSLGLFLAKSAGTLLALAGAMLLKSSWGKNSKSLVRVLLKVALPGVLVLTIFALFAWNFRRGDVEGLLYLTQGSWVQHLMLLYAGWRVFLDHPLFGRGWMATTLESSYSPEFYAKLMSVFPQVPSRYFPGWLTLISFHNLYSKLLAETGLVGLALFVFGCVRSGKTIMNIVRDTPEGSLQKMYARFYALSLLFFVLWWNSHALFRGGYIDDVLAVTFLSALAAITRLERNKVNLAKNPVPGEGISG